MFGNTRLQKPEPMKVAYNGDIKAAQFTEDEEEFAMLLALVARAGYFSSVQYNTDGKVVVLAVSADRDFIRKQYMSLEHWFVSFENSIGGTSSQTLSHSQFTKQFKVLP